MATPAAVLSILVKTQGAKVAAAELRGVDAAAKGANTNLAGVQKHSAKTGGTLRALGGAAKYTGGLIGATGLALGLKSAVTEFREAQKVGAQTTAVLKSTGGAANVTKKHIEDLANAISRKSGIDDEAIQSNANLLLTFTNIRNEVGKGNKIFDQATQAVTDMSVALGQSGKSSAIQLGKALNDPIKGITALRRVGVSFTDQQKDQIKALVEHGDKLKAQKIILKEITKEFGGSAAAQATAGDKMRVAFGNLAEVVGTALVPVMDKVIKRVTVFVQQMVDGTGAGGRFVDKMKDIWGALKPVLQVTKDVVKWLAQHPALLAAAAGAWAAYKTAALIQLGITKAAMLGLFGGPMRAKMVAQAGKTGTAAGSTFAAKAGLAAAAGIGGWEIGKWMRKNWPAVRDAGDALGTQLGEAIFGGSKLQGFVDRYIEQLNHKLEDALNGLKSTVGSAGKIGNKAFQGVTGRKVTRKKGPKRVVHTASVKKPMASMSRTTAKRGSGSSDIAATIIAVGRSMGASDKQILAALEAGIVESGLQNLPYGDRDSVGVFQQRPSQGWTGLMNVPKAAREFYAAAMKVGGAGMTAGQLAQAVQRSAYPGRYDAVQGRAMAILGGAGGGGTSRPRSVPLPKAEKLPPLSKAFIRRYHRIKARRQRILDERSMKKAAFNDRTLGNPWVQAALTHIDNLVAAGQMTEAEGLGAKSQILMNALNAPNGLVGEDRLVAQGMVNDYTTRADEIRFGGGTSEDPNQALTDAQEEANRLQQEANRLAQEQIDAVAALKKEIETQNHHADAVRGVSLGVAWKALADVISGQIAGPGGYQGRASTAGAGSTYRL